MKKAIIIIDENQIKIVVSNILKTMGTHEVHLPHNKSFLEKLFASYEVVMLESVVKLDFTSFIGSFPQPATAPSAVLVPSVPPNQPVQAPVQTAIQPVAQPQPLPQSIVVNTASKAVQTEKRRWIRTTSDSTIIIDDLVTGQEIRGVPGSKQCLAIPPGKPVDLTTLSPESLKRSAILRALVKNGTIVSVSEEEAKKMMAHYEAVQNGTYSITDRDILPSNISAEAYARMIKSGVRPTADMMQKTGEEMIAADGNDHDAIPIDLGRGFIGHGGGGGGGGSRVGGIANEHCGNLSMEELMVVLEEESAMGAYRVNPVESSREKAPATSFAVSKINKLD
jgi:hypothetical protein